MVTLAFAQAGQVLVQKNPHQLTGGEEGLGLNSEPLPDFFVGVLNTKYLYWLALGYAVVVFLVVRCAVACSPGHVWQAIRENERRVEVIGLRPFGFKLIVVRARLVPRDHRRGRLAARPRDGRQPAGDDRQLHADAARDGRASAARARATARCSAASSTRLLDQRLGALAGSSQVAGSAVGASKAALGAALHPRHALHPARLLRARRARRPRAPRADAAPLVRPRGRHDEDRLGAPRSRAAAAPDPRARLRALGLGARGRAARRAPSTSSSSTTAASARATRPQARTRPPRWPPTRSRCSTRRESSARTWSARASAG